MTSARDGLARSLQVRLARRRRTGLPQDMPQGLGGEFASDSTKQTQWRQFLSKNRLEAPALDEVIAEIRAFITEPLKLARQQKETA